MIQGYEKIFDAQASNDVIEYNISAPTDYIILDVFGTDSPDGEISFSIKGVNGVYTEISGQDYKDGRYFSTINSLDTNGRKLKFNTNGLGTIKITLSGMTTGSVTAYISEVIGSGESPLKRNINSESFLFRVSMGLEPYYSYIEKFGQNPDVDTATTPEDIWDGGGEYTFSSTADINKISSSSASDTSDLVIIGLDENYELVTQTKTLQGQTEVSLDTDLIRVFRSYNNSGASFVGDVYVYTGSASGGVPTSASNIRAKILAGENQTLMCIYTVPASYTGYLYSRYTSLSNAKNSTETASVEIKIREFGKSFNVKGTVGLSNTGSSYVNKDYKIPLPITEKSDVKMTCTGVTADNTAVAGGFTILLHKNNQIG